MVRLKSFHDNKQCAAITLDTMKQKGYTILLLKLFFFQLLKEPWAGKEKVAFTSSAMGFLSLVMLHVFLSQLPPYYIGWRLCNHTV